MNPTTSSTDTSSRWLRLAPWLIFGLALVLRIPNLDYSFYGDEHFSLLRDSSRLITNTDDRFRPVFFSLLYLWRQIGFHGEIGLRLLPLLFGLAQIPLAWVLGRRIGGRSFAALFAFLVATSPILIEFSQEVRPYSMVVVLALVQMWVYLLLLERATALRWAGFVLVAVVGVYTHLHYWLFLAGFALSFWRERRALPLWKGWGTLGAAVLLYLPNLPNLMIFAAKRGGSYSLHLPSAFPKLLGAVTVGFNYFALGDQGTGRPMGLADVQRNWLLALLALIPAAILLWSLVRLHARSRRTSTLLLCHELSTVPVLLAFVASAVTGEYWLQPKYLIFVMPPVLLFIAIAFRAIEPRLLRRTTAVFGLAVLAVAMIHFWTPTQYSRRENWRRAVEVLQRDVGPSTAVLVLPAGYELLRYYWPQVTEHWEIITVPRIAATSPIFAADVRARLSGKNDVFYIWWDIPQNREDPQNVLLSNLKRIGTSGSVIHYTPRFKLYHWQLR